MSRYLGTNFGENVKLAIRCTRYYQTKNRPFTSFDVGINPHTLKKLANAGILDLVSGKRSREPNMYIVPKHTIELLERRYPDEL